MTSSSTQHSNSKTVVVIGNGMVGQRFCERLVEFDTQREWRIVTFCEEPRAAYDRVGLTSFFAHRDAHKLQLARQEWYAENGVELHLGDRASSIDRKKRIVRSDRGVEIFYDRVVLATGSFPFVPPVPGIDKQGVFVYRTIDDLEQIIKYAGRSKRCAILGGGLLGLEAAKAAYDLGLETHVVEFAPRLMPRQVDDAGSRILVRRIEELGVKIHLEKTTKEIHGNGCVERIEFKDGEALELEMIIVSAGIRPRDDLAKQSGLEIGQRGGITVNDRLETSDFHVYAIGECALSEGMVYGLVAPGYEMAEIVAANMTGAARQFKGSDLSAKLKLMGVDVASFGKNELPPDQATALQFEDPFKGIYKKLLFSKDGSRLLGGILVGDTADYGKLLMLAKNDAALNCEPHELVVGKASAGESAGGLDGMPDTAQICSCNNVLKGAICAAVRNQGLDNLDDLKKCTKAGTGCGGCVPLVADLLKAEMKRAGKAVVNHLCEHFPYSRTELFAIVKTKQLRTFAETIDTCGSGNGCETCKPAVASILASLWNENITDAEHVTLQDTNDRFMANMQRGGLYSVVPRVPGGEITPEKLGVIAEVAKQFGLYTKITGGQRIDMFGAQVQDLPDIWERLVNAGFESGHAYGKALRTVKSCVGTTWCRYGVQDSVGFAIRVENRYKGIRAPHKIKMAVSGCVRECAEAQSKDVGLIATEQGYNLYVCGNGGSKPRHAELLASDIDEETAIKYIDRFLMYYITTADKLTRTSVWCEKLEGGLDHIRDVVVHDKLGIAAELEAMLQRLVDTYQCEWAAAVRDPERRKWFRQFANTDETESCIEIVSERGQTRPADWPSDVLALDQFRMLDGRSLAAHQQEQLKQTQFSWVGVGSVADFPADGGATIKYGQTQIAVFNFSSRGEWYASQNMCPHKKAFVLSRGILGDAAGEPKVACPLHKKTFSLNSGESLQGEEYRIRTFPVKVEAGEVYLELPPAEVLDKALATEIGCKLATACDSNASRVKTDFTLQRHLRPAMPLNSRISRLRKTAAHEVQNVSTVPIINERPTSLRLEGFDACSPELSVRSEAADFQEGCLSDREILLRRLLGEQRQIEPPPIQQHALDKLQRTAVEAFSEHCDLQARSGSLRTARYRELLPASPPQSGQQYAFEVDLDRCSGCKACVTACHSLNGLDETETWRDVGLLIGGTRSLPVLQHVTAACHHCLQPACLIACPVNAYEKDPVTGIVKHLDDQCFGCQYCTLACPYDVPKYHSAKGIVRKCDMCSTRLAVGEAPACVQACPHQAIAIRTVDVRQIIEDSEVAIFLPGAPDPQITLPTTTYKTKKPFPRNLLPADYFRVDTQHTHWPLVVMLVLTQLSVGAFSVGLLLEVLLEPRLVAALRLLLAANALGFGLLALSASVLHLGRPFYAFRAILGLRHSWLSREIVAFGLFAALASAYAVAIYFTAGNPPIDSDFTSTSPVPWLQWLGISVAGSGAVAVFCSIMIYVFTQRECWSFTRVAVRFVLTSALLGMSVVWFSILGLTLVHPTPELTELIQRHGTALCTATIAFAGAKLLWDATIFRHLMFRRMTSLKRSAMLMTHELSNITLARFAAGILGGLVLPILLLISLNSTESSNVPKFVILTGMQFVACLVGEILERALFFTSCATPRMPGAIR